MVKIHASLPVTPHIPEIVTRHGSKMQLALQTPGNGKLTFNMSILELANIALVCRTSYRYMLLHNVIDFRPYQVIKYEAF